MNRVVRYEFCYSSIERSRMDLVHRLAVAWPRRPFAFWTIDSVPWTAPYK